MRVPWHLLIFLAAAEALPAATVVVNGGSVTLRSLSGTFLTSPPTLLRLGFFTNQDFNSPSGTCPAIEMLGHIQQYFVPLGEAGSPPGYGTPASNTLRINPQTGSVAGGILDIAAFLSGTPNTVENGFVPRGTRLYLLVYEGGPVFTTGLGVFSATTWTVPLPSVLNNASLPMSHVDTWEEVIIGWEAVAGGSGSLGTSIFCPEPGVVALALVPALVFTGRRRR